MSITSQVLRRAALVSVAVGALLSGCNKPSEDSCRKALANIRHLLGTEHLSQADQTVEGEVRRCRGGSKRASVDCAIKATNLDELRACKLIEIPAGAGSGSPGAATPAPAAPAADGSAATPAAPAADGSAATPAAPAAAPATEPAPPAAPAAAPAATTPKTPAGKPATEVPAAPAKQATPPAGIAPGEPAPPSIAPGEPAPPAAATPPAK